MVVAVVGMFEILHGPSHRWNSDSEQPLSPLADRPAPTIEGKSPVRAYPACASSPRKTQDLIPSQGTGWLGRTAFNTGWDHYYHMKRKNKHATHHMDLAMPARPCLSTHPCVSGFTGNIQSVWVRLCNRMQRGSLSSCGECAEIQIQQVSECARRPGMFDC